MKRPTAFADDQLPQALAALRRVMPGESAAVEILPLDAIRVDGGTQGRVGLDLDTVLVYLDLTIEGVDLPAGVGFRDSDGVVWLSDGFHRHEARRRAGRPDMAVEVRAGTRRDAILHAAGANDAHGLRRTNDDRRHAVRLLVADPEWATWSDRAVAMACKVSHTFVARVRRELEAEARQRRPSDATGAGSSSPDAPNVRTGRDGRKRDTTAIAEANRARATPPPAMPPDDLEEPPAPTTEGERAVELRRLRDALERLAPSREEIAVVVEPLAAKDVRAAVRTQRRANDAYYTPDHVAYGCVRWLLDEGLLGRRSSQRILEPHVGGGAWVRALRLALVPGIVETLDVDRDAPGLVDEDGNVGEVGDFLTHDVGAPDIILGNPPFGPAELHVRRALEVVRHDGLVAFILRRNWMAPARAAFVAEGLAPLRELILCPRVSFTDDTATDLQEYSLFVWRPGLERREWTTSMLDVGRGGGRSRAG